MNVYILQTNNRQMLKSVVITSTPLLNNDYCITLLIASIDHCKSPNPFQYDRLTLVACLRSSIISTMNGLLLIREFILPEDIVMVSFHAILNLKFSPLRCSLRVG